MIDVAGGTEDCGPDDSLRRWREEYLAYASERGAAMGDGGRVTLALGRPRLAHLTRLAARGGCPIVDLVFDAVDAYLARADNALAIGMPIEDCIAAVSAVTGQPSGAILGASRKKHAVKARHLAMWVARIAAGLSYPQIGTLFGRDHSSVMHAIARIEADREDDPDTFRTTEMLLAAATCGAGSGHTAMPVATSDHGGGSR